MQKVSTPKLGPNPPVPKSLRKVQTWLGNAVMTETISKAEHYITASSQLSAHERLTIYLRDYWPRCIESLEEDFPGLKLAFGEEKFELWMRRYLIQHPSHSFTLFYLGQDLIPFMETQYQDSDKALILDIVRYEWAKNKAYFAAEKPAFNPSQLTQKQQQDIAALPLELHPSVTILSLSHDCIKAIQQKFKKTPKAKDCYIVIFRDSSYSIQEQFISKLFYKVLSHLEQKKTIEMVLDALMAELSDKDQHYLAQHIQTWLSLCVQKGWLCHSKI